MNLRKMLLWGALLSMGLLSCKKDEPQTENSKTDTYVGVSIRFAQSASVRDLPEDYNAKGEWDGRDKIETVTVYLVNQAKGTVDYTSFTKDNFEAISNGVLKPTLAVQGHAGDAVRVYAVINGKTEILNKLNTTDASEFDATFKGEAEAIASQLAKYNTGDKTETIMMTNATDETINVVSGASEDDAKNGVKNRANVNVERVVSRAMLTVEKKSGDNHKIMRDIKGVKTAIAEVNAVTYSIGQSNKKFFIMKKANNQVPDPVFSFTPVTGNDWTTNNKNYFDYSELGTKTQAVEYAYDTEQLTDKLKEETTSKFVLPVTHEDSKYKKGNVTYIEVQATFTPTKEAWGDTEKTYDTWKSETNKTVYFGASNGKFYASKEAAQNAAKGGVDKQKVSKYLNGVMYYVVWLNPDQIKGAQKSPTVRNQIYHAHINSFKEIGLPNNPLNPDDPNKPDDPDTPDNPIKPEDPITTEKTYLSVKVEVLKWKMHSYKIDLGTSDY